MAFCTMCGAEVEDGNKFCIVCGEPLPFSEKGSAEPGFEPAPAPASVEDQSRYAPTAPPEKKADISVGMFIGIFILFSIPLVGLIFAIAWACKATKNKTLVNLSRAWLILWTICLVVAIITAIAIVSLILANIGDIVYLFEELLYSFEGLNISVNY